MQGVRRPGGLSDSESDDDCDYVSSPWHKKIKSEPQPLIESGTSMTDTNRMATTTPTEEMTVVKRFGIGRGIVPPQKYNQSLPSPPRGQNKYQQSTNHQSFVNTASTSRKNFTHYSANNQRPTAPTRVQCFRPQIRPNNDGARLPSSSSSSSVVVSNNVCTRTKDIPSQSSKSFFPQATTTKDDPRGHSKNLPTNNNKRQSSAEISTPSTAPNYIGLHSMNSKVDQIQAIPNLNFAKAEISYNIIKQAWNTVRNEELFRQCRKAYESSEHPLYLGLFFMMRSHDFANPQGNRNLCSSVIVELQKFLSSATDWESLYLTPDIKKLAFHLVLTYRKMDLKHLVVEVFKIREIQDDLVQDIKLLSKQCLFKQALAGSLVLELFTFDIHVFLIPMILQDRLLFVEEYFDHDGARQLLLKTIRYLDQIASQGWGIGNWLYNYTAERKIDMKTILQDKINPRTLAKLVKRFSNKYNVEPSSFPNISNRQQLSALRHILWRRFSEDSSDMTDTNFQDIVAGLIKDDPVLTEEALYQMKINAGIDYVVEFVKAYSVPNKCLPTDIAYQIENATTNGMVKKVEENWEDWEMDDQQKPTTSSSFGQNKMQETVSQQPVLEPTTKVVSEEPNETLNSSSNTSHYTLPIGVDKIKMVSTLVDFQFFINYLRQELMNTNEALVVGVDSEWKPIQSKSAALLQIAFHQQIFLVDLLMLGNIKLADGVVSPFEIMLNEFFGNSKVLKIGYDFKNDFTMLCNASLHWSNLKEKSLSILDLRTLQILIQKQNSNFFPFSTVVERGLRELVHICFNKILDKSEQFSDWSRRPLRSSQVTYAAADAYVLIEILDLITERDKAFPVGLGKLIVACQKPPDIKKEEPCRKLKVPIEVIHAVFDAKNNEQKQGEIRKHTVKNVRILCDKMLEGLGRLLRSFGLKTVILKSDNSELVSEHEMIMSGKAYGALVITRGKNRYNDFLFDFPPDQVLYVKSDVYTDQVLEVFEYFSIQPERKYCHTVCFHCNNSVFIKASKPFVKNIFERRGYKKSKTCTQQALATVTQKIPTEMIIYMKEDDPRPWFQLLEEDAIVIRPSDDRVVNITFTSKETPIDIKKIPPHLIDSYIDEFYICNTCGTLYWSSEKIENMIYDDLSSGSSGTQEMTTEGNC